MQSVNIFEAKTNLSKLLKALEQGEESEIIIARHGKSIAKLSLVEPCPADKRLGVAKGKFTLPDTFDVDNTAIQHLFAAGRE